MNKLLIKIITIMVLIGFLGACTSPAYNYRKELVASEITIPLNKMVKAADTGLSVSFNKIESDSRCAINARCLWAGAAVVKATVTNEKGESKTLTLSTVNYETFNNTAKVFGKRVTLIDLLPKPVAGKSAKPELTPPSIKVKID